MNYTSYTILHYSTVQSYRSLSVSHIKRSLNLILIYSNRSLNYINYLGYDPWYDP